MDSKAKNTILEKLDQLEKERKEIELQLEVEKSEILDFKLEDLRYYVKRSNTLTIPKPRTDKHSLIRLSIRLFTTVTKKEKSVTM